MRHYSVSQVGKSELVKGCKCELRPPAGAPAAAPARPGGPRARISATLGQGAALWEPDGSAGRRPLRAAGGGHLAGRAAMPTFAGELAIVFP